MDTGGVGKKTGAINDGADKDDHMRDERRARTIWQRRKGGVRSALDAEEKREVFVLLPIIVVVRCDACPGSDGLVLDPLLASKSRPGEWGVEVTGVSWKAAGLAYIQLLYATLYGSKAVRVV